jgi:hypothetical protein
MEIWTPDENDPYDQAWWRPLELVAFVVARDRALPRLGIDEFMFMGRVVRRSRPDIWLYKHYETRRYLNLDESVQSYRYLHLPSRADDPDAIRGRYLKLPSLRIAMFHAHLHLVDEFGRFRPDAEDVSEVATQPVARHLTLVV